MCAGLLGVVPTENDIKGNKVKLTWLTNSFNHLPPDADDEQVRRHARAWILRCIGGLLFTSQSSNMVHLMFLPLLADLDSVGNYSWGSACLAWLYREMCRATDPNASGLAGYVQLLQMWAWERLPQFRPKFRNAPAFNENAPYGYRYKSNAFINKFFVVI